VVDVDVAVLWESGVMVWEREGRAGVLYRFLTELRTQDAQGGVRVEWKYPRQGTMRLWSGSDVLEPGNIQHATLEDIERTRTLLSNSS